MDISGTCCRVSFFRQAFEFESGFHGDFLAVHLEVWPEEIVERASFRGGFDGDVAPAAELEAVSGMMAKIIIGQLRMLVGLADVDRHPFAVGMKLRPAVVAANDAGVLLAGMVKPMANRAGMLTARQRAMK